MQSNDEIEKRLLIASQFDQKYLREKLREVAFLKTKNNGSWNSFVYDIALLVGRYRRTLEIQGITKSYEAEVRARDRLNKAIKALEGLSDADYCNIGTCSEILARVMGEPSVDSDDVKKALRILKAYQHCRIAKETVPKHESKMLRGFLFEVLRSIKENIDCEIGWGPTAVAGKICHVATYIAIDKKFEGTQKEEAAAIKRYGEHIQKIVEDHPELRV